MKLLEALAWIFVFHFVLLIAFIFRNKFLTNILASTCNWVLYCDSLFKENGYIFRGSNP